MNNMTTQEILQKTRSTKNALLMVSPEVKNQALLAMADEIIKVAKSKKTPQEILCNYVNEQCGLKGFCVKVLVDLQ